MPAGFREGCQGGSGLPARGTRTSWRKGAKHLNWPRIENSREAEIPQESQRQTLKSCRGSEGSDVLSFRQQHAREDLACSVPTLETFRLIVFNDDATVQAGVACAAYPKP